MGLMILGMIDLSTIFVALKPDKSLAPPSMADFSLLKQLIAKLGPNEFGQLLLIHACCSLVNLEISGDPDFKADTSLVTQLDQRDGPSDLGHDRSTHERFSEFRLDSIAFGEAPKVLTLKNNKNGNKMIIFICSYCT